MITVAELLGEGQAKSGTNGIPFEYTTAYELASLAQVTYYLHDHLGNMRVTYTAGCGAPDHEGMSERVLTLNHAADYHPYGSSLREYVNGAQEKYLTTHHERDIETGLDYRGARYYDAEVARFLSLDPLADDFIEWSTYNYVFGKPTSVIDPDGRGGWDVVKGVAASVWDNYFLALPGTDPRSSFSYSSGADYNLGQDIGDIASTVIGAVLTVKGAADVAAGINASIGGTLASAPTAGLSLTVTAAGVGLVAQGAGEIAIGMRGMSRAYDSYSSNKGRVPEGNQGSSVEPAGRTASGHPTDKYGNKLGPSGEPQFNKVRHSTPKAAKDKPSQGLSSSTTLRPYPRKVSVIAAR